MFKFLDWDKKCFVGANNDIPSLACLPFALWNLITAALMLCGVTAVCFLIVAGYKFIKSGGEAKQVDGAKKTATWAIAGLIFILLSFFFMNVLSYITGVDCIKAGEFSFNCGQTPTTTP